MVIDIIFIPWRVYGIPQSFPETHRSKIAPEPAVLEGEGRDRPVEEVEGELDVNYQNR
jgi:hypothetical protein